MTDGISSLVLVQDTPAGTILLAVHDNKAPGEPRLTLLTWNDCHIVASRHLSWPDESPPADLEAVASVPGRSNEFIVSTSSGAACAIVLAPDYGTFAVRARFKLPDAPPEPEFEGLDLQSIGSRIVACWGDRGAGEKPAQLFWADLNLETLTFGPVESTAWRAPWPLEHNRHLSELRLRADGTLLISASSDPGDAGPFAGAIYVAGTFRDNAGQVTFTPEPEPSCFFATSEHKLEGIALLPGPPARLILGADDETRGGALFSSVVVE